MGALIIPKIFQISIQDQNKYTILILSKPVARHFILPGRSHKHMQICGINLHLENNSKKERTETHFQTRDLGSQRNQ